MKKRDLAPRASPADAGDVLTSTAKAAPHEEYAGQQFVGIDLHRRRSVLVRMTDAGEVLESARILNDVESLDLVIGRAGGIPRWSWRLPTAGIGQSTRSKRLVRTCIWRIRWG